MDLTTIRAVLTELQSEIIPSRFEKAFQPDPQTLQLGFRNLKRIVWLEISWRPDTPRIVVIPSPSYECGESTLAKQLLHGLQKMALTTIHKIFMIMILLLLLLISRQMGKVPRH